MPLLVDLETRSRVDLPSRGGLIYAKDASTQVLCFAWQDSEILSERGIWFPGLNVRPMESMIKAQFPNLAPGDVYVSPEVPSRIRKLTDRPWAAHNAWGFDALVWAALYGDCLPTGWIDTVHYARACGLPGGLEAIGKTLRGAGKHTEGRGHLKKFMAYKNEPRAGDLLLIGAYCGDDTWGLLKTLWDHIEKKRKQGVFCEQDVIDADRQINEHGVRVDIAFAEALLHLGDRSLERILKRLGEIAPTPLDTLSGKPLFSTLEGLRKVPKVHEWLATAGITITTTDKDGNTKKSLARGVIQTWLDQMVKEERDGDDHDDSLADRFDDSLEDTVDRKPDSGVARRLSVPAKVVEFLRLRGQATRITSSKIKAAMNGTMNGRMYHLLAYGAAHTMRWGGRRFQPQNLSGAHEQVPLWKVIEEFERTGTLSVSAVDSILDDWFRNPDNKSKKDRATLEDACGTCLRSILLPEPGEFICGVDYNAIEGRGLDWVSNGWKGIEMWAKGIDPYIEMAKIIFGVSHIDKNTPVGKAMRQVGKVVVLGAGYQLGHERLDGYALAQGIDLAASGTDALTCIQAYRDSHDYLAGYYTGETWKGIRLKEGGFWKNVNAAAIKAVKEGYAECERLSFRMYEDDLHMVLPSGRPLVYRKADVQKVTPKWGGRQIEAVHYFSPRGFTNTLYGGKITENAVQALCRDLLAASLVRCIKAGLNVILHVHDEIVCSVRNEEEALLVGKCMAEKPEWAKDFPLLCEGEMMTRYAKSAPKGAYKFEVRG